MSVIELASHGGAIFTRNEGCIVCDPVRLADCRIQLLACSLPLTRHALDTTCVFAGHRQTCRACRYALPVT